MNRPLVRSPLLCGVLTLGLLLAPVATLAQVGETSATPPEGMALLRIVMPVGETVRIDGQNLVPGPDSPASPYTPVNADPEIVVSDVRTTLSTPAGARYSYLWGISGSGALVEDMTPASEDEALLRLYNLTPMQDLDLWAVDLDQPVIAAVGSMDGAGAAFSPGAINLELRRDDEVLMSWDDVVLEPGRATSIAVWGDPGDLGAEVFPDQYE